MFRYAIRLPSIVRSTRSASGIRLLPSPPDTKPHQRLVRTRSFSSSTHPSQPAASSSSPSAFSLRERYERLVKENRMHTDEDQLRCVELLGKCKTEILHSVESGHWQPCWGVYVHGGSTRSASGIRLLPSPPDTKPHQRLVRTRSFSSSTHPSQPAASSSSPSAFSLRERYERLVKENRMHTDEDQLRCVELLGKCKTEILHSVESGHWQPCWGVYVHGPVGCGKTTILDLFVEDLRESLEGEGKDSDSLVQRLHFLDFVQGVHKTIHNYRLEKRRQGTNEEAWDSIGAAAAAVLEKGRVICVDELQILGIADAMVCLQLFKRLWEEGAVLVASSNCEPASLYRDGLNRDLFVPFIDLLESHCRAKSMHGETDYRLVKRSSGSASAGDGSSSSSASTPSEEGDNKTTNDLFDSRPSSSFISPCEGREAEERLRGVMRERWGVERLKSGPSAESDGKMELSVWGRKVTLREVYVSERLRQEEALKGREKEKEAAGVGHGGGLVALIEFSDICAQQWYNAEFSEVATTVSAVVLLNIPQFGEHQRDEARRLVSFLDVIYDSEIPFVVTAAAAPASLFIPVVEGLINTAGLSGSLSAKSLFSSEGRKKGEQNLDSLSEDLEWSRQRGHWAEEGGERPVDAQKVYERRDGSRGGLGLSASSSVEGKRRKEKRRQLAPSAATREMHEDFDEEDLEAEAASPGSSATSQAAATGSIRVPRHGGTSGKHVTMFSVLGHVKEEVEWSATGLRVAALHELAPQHLDSLWTFRRAASRLAEDSFERVRVKRGGRPRGLTG
uniref:AAA+ ATPase domain-containing protein n=1 Tax=Chromera velia CCMP2878 TaxID=1169474 RepID=A0A0G4HHR2_9ALVE|eukprot:Cvel_27567.t1-p1 / transcript=Cvel_27567.t1 / gene=Cvel_27567 / organism=Chromera_velia_CCMP2878 / gene_product=Lactation elevated protein 1, putative / transcript_product=Lactation elevated protein 1, putative / location=Cvel_scaffold3463:5536-14570(-) / protein_length=789 / sequence_SO=supercontig / SO=protein_coding / is_pseudo=false